MEHIERVLRAIDYIEEHLKDELPTESIADVAHFGEELRDAPTLTCRHPNYAPDSEDSVMASCRLGCSRFTI